ncbi:hypothetical protein D0Z03_001890 [Geotrichum reessii]|nr:hypothetical protein D0Z03_001890 [Galactomyces reessii]
MGGLTRYATDADEAGGLGDAMDLLSVRDAAVMRYLRYHEWIDLVVGSAVPTHALVSFPAKLSTIENELMSLYIRPLLEQQKREAEKEEKAKEPEVVSSVGLSERAKTLARLTEQLRHGLDASADEIRQVETEIKEKIGASVVFKPKFDVIKESISTNSDDQSTLQQQQHQIQHHQQQLSDQQSGVLDQSHTGSQALDVDEDSVMGNNEFGFEYSEPDTTFEATVPTDTGLNLGDDGTNNSITVGADHAAVTSTSNGSLDFTTQSHQQSLDTGLLGDDAGSEFISLGNDNSDPNNDSVLNLLDL